MRRTGSLIFGAAALLSVLPFSAPATAQETAPPTSVYGSGLFELGDGLPPAGHPGTAQILARPDQPGPAWSDLIGADGWARDEYPESGNGVPDYRELWGGLWLAYMADDEDADVSFEPTARGANDNLVINGAVAATQDLDSLMGYVTQDATGNPVLYLAASRVAAGTALVELELNQDFRRLGAGGFTHNLPWPVIGIRMPGDLRIRLQFYGAELASASVDVWLGGILGGAWEPVHALDGEGCNLVESFCALTNAVAIESPIAIAGLQPTLEPGSFVVVGLGLDATLTSLPDFITLRAKTAQDLAFAYFTAGGR